MAATDGGTDWEQIARQQLELSATEVGGDVEQAIRLLGVEIGRGDAERDDVVDARASIESAIYFVEDDLASVVPGADGGSSPAKYIRNDGAAADYLDLTMEQVSEARYGTTAELTVDQIRVLNNGGSVVVETPGGITVELQPTNTAETNTGP